MLFPHLLRALFFFLAFHFVIILDVEKSCEDSAAAGCPAPGCPWLPLALTARGHSTAAVTDELAWAQRCRLNSGLCSRVTSFPTDALFPVQEPAQESMLRPASMLPRLLLATSAMSRRRFQGEGSRCPASLSLVPSSLHQSGAVPKPRPPVRVPTPLHPKANLSSLARSLKGRLSTLSVLNPVCPEPLSTPPASRLRWQLLSS